jgi:hypothetical protein
MDARIIWGLADDPEGNVQHMRDHDVTVDELKKCC